MRHILSILVENEAGALSRVAGLFSARGYNIETLTVAPTEDTTMSRMTIVTTGSDEVVEQITKQLNKLVDVVKVVDLSEGKHIERELMLVKGKKVTIIGYGSQGHAHAQNLTESGVKVTVGLRPGGASWEKVKKAKIAVKEVGEAVKGADLVMILLPDENHAQVYKDSV